MPQASAARKIAEVDESVLIPPDVGLKRTVKIHYRRAKLEGVFEEPFTLQERLDRAMKTAISKDVSKRLFKVTPADDGPQGCLNLHQSTLLAFVADIMHFDRRNVSLRFVHSDQPTPIATIKSHEIEANESSLGDPVYFMVRGNHLAVIERPGFSLAQFSRYLNALLAAAGELETATFWKLAPQFEYASGLAIDGAVKKVVFKPRAAIEGYGATLAPEPRRRNKGTQAFIEDVLANGGKVLEILAAAGIRPAKIEALREAMSSDLAIRAKIEFSVIPVKRKTTAEVSSETMHLALAGIADEGDIEIVAADGKARGKLASLSHKAEVLEVRGLLEWTRATEALASALATWYAKGAIDIPALPE